MCRQPAQKMLICDEREARAIYNQNKQMPPSFSRKALAS